MKKDPRPDMVDAVALLTAAIRMHEKHLKDPDSDTEESQKEMMLILKEARKSVRAAFDGSIGRTDTHERRI